MVRNVKPPYYYYEIYDVQSPSLVLTMEAAGSFEMLVTL
jgi:hypothetical protein